MTRWREAMAAALYGREGFFTRTGAPAAHFRTSATASPAFAAAVLRLLERVDAALAHPDRLDLVDVGAGGGELLANLVAAAPPPLAARLRAVAVEVAGRPADLPALVEWRQRPLAGVCGLLVATEWLDNIPVDVAEMDPDGVVRYVLVDAAGAERLGDPVTGPDADWLARWWPLPGPGSRAEIGRPRDEAWAGVVATVRHGAALAVDYGHLAGGRPWHGSLTGFRDGRQVPPVPDGSCDLTAHVALDAVAHAGRFALHTDTPLHGGSADVCRAKVGAVMVPDKTPDDQAPPREARLLTQAEALRGLGVDATRPPLALAHRDPAGYLRRLAAASAAGELTDPAGLGGHHWLLQPIALPRPIPPFVARLPA